MTDKETKSSQKPLPSDKSTPIDHDRNQQKGLAENNVTEHHVEGAEGPQGAEAEEDNNP